MFSLHHARLALRCRMALRTFAAPGLASSTEEKTTKSRLVGGFVACMFSLVIPASSQATFFGRLETDPPPGLVRVLC